MGHDQKTTVRNQYTGNNFFSYMGHRVPYRYFKNPYILGCFFWKNSSMYHTFYTQCPKCPICFGSIYAYTRFLRMGYDIWDAWDIESHMGLNPYWDNKGRSCPIPSSLSHTLWDITSENVVFGAVSMRTRVSYVWDMTYGTPGTSSPIWD